MIFNGLILLGGLLIIIKGGDLFVSASVRMAEFLRLPRIVIGSTLVSLATTSPELVVSIMSGWRQESGLAVGNAVGSCVCNIGLILGASAFLRRIDIHPAALRFPMTAMIGAAVLLLLMTLDLRLSRLQGWILLLLGLAYFIYDFLRHEREARPREMVEARQIEERAVAGHAWLRTRWGTACQFLGGAALVLVGSRLLVDAAVRVAAALGVPSIIIGLTVVAVGTSLPELVTALSSSRQNVSDLAVGNILGANVANLTLVIGSAGALSEVRMSRAVQMFNFPALLVAMFLVVTAIRSNKSIVRREGILLLGYYAFYIVALVALTLLGWK